VSHKHRQRRPDYPERHDRTARKVAFDSMQKRLVRKYGEEIGPWLTRRVASMFRTIRDTYCVDNFRVCDTAISDEVTRYTEQQSTGCCGSYDGQITHFASGRTFKFGCNFGH